jgi:hypothetical protein
MNWAKTCVRKPMAVYSAAWGAGIVSLAFYFERDIPPGIVDVMKVLIGACVGGYCLSSGWEAGKTSLLIAKENEK